MYKKGSLPILRTLKHVGERAEKNKISQSWLQVPYFNQVLSCCTVLQNLRVPYLSNRSPWRVRRAISSALAPTHGGTSRDGSCSTPCCVTCCKTTVCSTLLFEKLPTGRGTRYQLVVHFLSRGVGSFAAPTSLRPFCVEPSHRTWVVTAGS